MYRSIAKQNSSVAPDGNTVTATIQSTEVYAGATTTSTAVASSGSKSTPVGAIVGGTVGGVVFLAALSLCLLAFMRRRRKRALFDGNFDPDNVAPASGRGAGNSAQGGTLPNIGVDDEDVHGDPVSSAVSPYPIMAQYHPQQQQQQQQFNPYTGRPGSMSNIGGGAYDRVPTSPTSTHPHSRHPSQGGYAAYGGGPASSDHASSYFSHGTSSAAGPSASGYAPGSGVIPSTKERERLRLANADEGGPVLQHRDGGRMAPQEIPPSYDSIPADERTP
jgi:hypothetical protein